MTARKPKPSLPDHRILDAGNHYDEARRNSLFCVMCGARWRLAYGSRGMPIDQFVATTKAFEKAHAGCKPRSADDIEELYRRLFAYRRDYGTSANALEQYACVRLPYLDPFPDERPHDASDLAAAGRRLAQLHDLKRDRGRPLLDEFKKAVPGFDVDGAMAAEGVVTFLLWAGGWRWPFVDRG